MAAGPSGDDVPEHGGAEGPAGRARGGAPTTTSARHPLHRAQEALGPPVVGRHGRHRGCLAPCRLPLSLAEQGFDQRLAGGTIGGATSTTADSTSIAWPGAEVESNATA